MAVKSIAPWRTLSDRALAETPIFTLRQKRCRSGIDAGKEGDFVYLDCPAWINVIALTAAREVVMVDQFRHGSAGPSLEIPGGMCDPGEGLVEAGLRELREETGYSGKGGKLIGSVEPNPAIQNNRCGTVLLRDAAPVSGQSLDPMEEILVKLVPFDEIGGLVRSGAITNAIVLSAFYLLHLWEGA
jgi:ADP-ribose pyrophosphatase